MELTETQTKVLGFLEDELVASGNAPTCREICKRFNFKSPKAATDHLAALEKKGYITRHPLLARGIQLNQSPRKIPVLGEIPAGWPTDASDISTGSIEFDLSSFGIRNRKTAFALVVKGDSMEGVNIFDGDIALIDSDGTPADGCVVAALIDNETTLKTFVRRHGKVWLKAENSRYPDLIPEWNLQIQGVACAVFRKLRK